MDIPDVAWYVDRRHARGVFLNGSCCFCEVIRFLLPSSLSLTLEIWGIDRRLVEDRRVDVKNARRFSDCRGALVVLGKRATGLDHPQEPADALKKECRKRTALPDAIACQGGLLVGRICPASF